MHTHRLRFHHVLCALLLSLPAPAVFAQYTTTQLAGPGQGLSNPDRTIFPSHNQHVVENAKRCTERSRLEYIWGWGSGGSER